LLEGSAGGIAQTYAGGRQRQAAPLPCEEGFAQIGFQRLDLPADCAMGDMQLTCRAGHAFQAGGGLESMQGIERRQFARHK